MSLTWRYLSEDCRCTGCSGFFDDNISQIDLAS